MLNLDLPNRYVSNWGFLQILAGTGNYRYFFFGYDTDAVMTE